MGSGTELEYIPLKKGSVSAIFDDMFDNGFAPKNIDPIIAATLKKLPLGLNT